MNGLLSLGVSLDELKAGLAEGRSLVTQYVQAVNQQLATVKGAGGTAGIGGGRVGGLSISANDSSALTRYASGIERLTTSGGKLLPVLDRMGKHFSSGLGIGTAVAGLATLERAFTSAIQKAEKFQTARLAISATLGTVGTVYQGGRPISGARAVEENMGQSRRLNLDLLERSTKNILTYEEQLGAFQSALNPGAKKGLSVKQITDLSESGGVVAKILGLRGEQISNATRLLMGGGVNVSRSTIGRALGIENKEVSRRSGDDLVKYLTGKMRGFADTPENKEMKLAFENSIEGIQAQLQSQIDRFLAEAGESFFTKVKPTITGEDNQGRPVKGDAIVDAFSTPNAQKAGEALAGMMESLFKGAKAVMDSGALTAIQKFVEFMASHGDKVLIVAALSKLVGVLSTVWDRGKKVADVLKVIAGTQGGEILTGGGAGTMTAPKGTGLAGLAGSRLGVAKGAAAAAAAGPWATAYTGHMTRNAVMYDVAGLADNARRVNPIDDPNMGHYRGPLRGRAMWKAGEANSFEGQTKAESYRRELAGRRLMMAQMSNADAFGASMVALGTDAAKNDPKLMRAAKIDYAKARIATSIQKAVGESASFLLGAGQSALMGGSLALLGTSALGSIGTGKKRWDGTDESLLQTAPGGIANYAGYGLAGVMAMRSGLGNMSEGALAKGSGLALGSNLTGKAGFLGKNVSTGAGATIIGMAAVAAGSTMKYYADRMNDAFEEQAYAEKELAKKFEANPALKRIARLKDAKSESGGAVHQQTSMLGRLFGFQSQSENLMAEMSPARRAAINKKIDERIALEQSTRYLTDIDSQKTDRADTVNRAELLGQMLDPDSKATSRLLNLGLKNIDTIEKLGFQDYNTSVSDAIRSGQLKDRFGKAPRNLRSIKDVMDDPYLWKQFTSMTDAKGKATFDQEDFDNFDKIRKFTANNERVFNLENARSTLQKQQGLYGAMYGEDSYSAGLAGAKLNINAAELSGEFNPDELAAYSKAVMQNFETGFRRKMEDLDAGLQDSLDELESIQSRRGLEVSRQGLQMTGLGNQRSDMLSDRTRLGQDIPYIMRDAQRQVTMAQFNALSMPGTNGDRGYSGYISRMQRQIQREEGDNLTQEQVNSFGGEEAYAQKYRQSYVASRRAEFQGAQDQVGQSQQNVGRVGEDISKKVRDIDQGLAENANAIKGLSQEISESGKTYAKALRDRAKQIERMGEDMAKMQGDPAAKGKGTGSVKQDIKVSNEIKVEGVTMDDAQIDMIVKKAAEKLRTDLTQACGRSASNKN